MSESLEKMLGPEKVRKVLGEDDDEKARKLALQQSPEMEIDIDLIKRLTINSNKNNKGEKIVNMFGETMIAGSKVSILSCLLNIISFILLG